MHMHEADPVLTHYGITTNNGRDRVSNHQPHDCLLNRLFRRRSKKTSKLRVTGLCAGNSPGTGEFSAQMASNAENVSISWRHHIRKWGMRFVKPRSVGTHTDQQSRYHNKALIIIQVMICVIYPIAFPMEVHVSAVLEMPSCSSWGVYARSANTSIIMGI